jgi:hypothetical protein
MTPGSDPIATDLTRLAESTLAAAPAPLPLALLRILAERRGAQVAVHRVLVRLTAVSLAPTAVVLLAWLLRPGVANDAAFPGLLLALTLAPPLGSIARLLGALHPARVPLVARQAAKNA